MSELNLNINKLFFHYYDTERSRITNIYGVTSLNDDLESIK